jgi:tetratricopeptide (TPR) repeat protein
MLPDAANARLPFSPAQLRSHLQQILASGALTPQEGMFLGALVERLLSRTLHGIDHKQLADDLHVGDGQLRKVATHVRNKLPGYYAAAGMFEPLMIVFPERGYEITVREVRPLASFPAPDRELFFKALRYRDALRGDTFGEAIAILESLLIRHPDTPAFHAVLADVYSIRPQHAVAPPLPDIEKASLHADAAIACNPNLWMAHAVKSSVYTMLWQWTSASASLNRALNLHAAAQLHPSYFVYHSTNRDFGRIIASMETESQRNDFTPLSLLNIGNRCFMHILSGRYQEAGAILLDTIPIAPHYHLLHIYLGVVNIAFGNFDKAIASLQTASALPGGEYLSLGPLAFTLAVSGRTADAARHLESMKTRAAEHYLADSQFALAYAGLRDDDSALECLERMVASHDPLALWLPSYPFFKHLESHPRYLALLRHMNLPEASGGVSTAKAGDSR